MAVARKITIELSAHAAEEIDAGVAAGVYEDAEAFVMDVVENSLACNDPEIECWLNEQVIPTYDRWKRAKTPGLTSEEVFGGLKERYLARKSAS